MHSVALCPLVRGKRAAVSYISFVGKTLGKPMQKIQYSENMITESLWNNHLQMTVQCIVIYVVIKYELGL